MKATKAEYEGYLNEVLEKEGTLQLAIGETEYVANPGTWMRKHDPIQFEVGYQEYCQNS